MWIRMIVLSVLGLCVASTTLAQDIEAGRGGEAAPDPPRRVVTLEEARTLLRENNTTLRTNTSVIEQVRLLERQATGVFLPTANVSLSYIYNGQEIVFQQPNTYTPLLPYLEVTAATHPGELDLALAAARAQAPGFPDARELGREQFEPAVIQFHHDFRFNASIRQTIFNMRAFPLLDMADISIAQAEQGQEQIDYQLQSTLQQLYFNAVLMQRRVDLARRNVELTRIDLKRAQDLLAADAGVKFEVTRAEVAVSRAEREVENARLGYNLSIEALALVMNVEPDFDVVRPPDKPIPSNTEELREQALTQRPEIRGAELAMQLEEERLSEVYAQWWPVVFAQAQMSASRGSLFANDINWSVMVTASWDIFLGGNRLTEAERVELVQQQRTYEYEEKKIQIERELQQSLIQIKSQQIQVITAQSEVELAQENLELTRAAAELQAATNLEVELARQQLFLSELALATAEVQLQVAVYELYRQSGELP